MSKFLGRFKRVQETAKDSFKLFGDRIVVEVLPKEELKKGSIVIATDIRNHKSNLEENRATLAVVLLTGNGYYNEETGEDVPLEVKQGDIVLVSALGLKYYSSFPGLDDFTDNALAMTRAGEVHMLFEGMDAYKRFRQGLSE